MRSMQDHGQQPKRGLALGIAGSVLLHVLPLAVFLINVSFSPPEPPQEEVVSVEIVPEPEPVPEPEKPPEPEAEKQPEPEAEKPPEPEPEQQQPAEAEPPPAPAPAATMLAIRPTVSDAPERDDAIGATEPKAEPSPVETGPKAEEGAPQEAPPAEGEPLPDAPLPTEMPPQATETAQDALEQTVGEGDLKGPETPDILAAASEAASADESGVVAIQHPPVPQPRPQPPASGARGDKQASGQVQTLKAAERLLSGTRLSDPAMREALGQLPLPKRIVQLCTVEALSQIMASRPGTMLHGMVPFGDKDGKIDNNTLTASGGAYRTMGGDWYDISFRCAVDVPNLRITAFDYRLGDHKLTRDERVARGLPRE